MVKKIKVMFRIAVVLCIALVMLTGCNSTKVKPTSNENKVNSDKEYLEHNYMPLAMDDNNDVASLKLLDGDLNKELFLTGQIYGVKANTDLELKFLKYLNEKADVKYYLQEIPYSSSISINEYIKTGDEKILQELFSAAKGGVLWSKEEYAKWKMVYEFNKSLPSNKKITVLGIDIEQNPITAFKYMKSMLPQDAPNPKIDGAIKELKDAVNISIDNGNAIKAFSERLKNSINENRDVYKLYLRDKAFDFEMINNNVLNAVDVFSSKDANEYNKTRGKKMYENFKYIYSNMPQKGKIYGQVFIYNMFLKSHKGIDYFATLLNGSDSPVKDKLVSVMYTYKNCDYMVMGQNGAYTSRPISNYRTDNNSLDSIIKDNIALVKLNGEDSPFAKDLLWIESTFYPGTRSGNEVTTDYYQYVVIIKNSPAQTPLDKSN